MRDIGDLMVQYCSTVHALLFHSYMASAQLQDGYICGILCGYVGLQCSCPGDSLQPDVNMGTHVTPRV